MGLDVCVPGSGCEEMYWDLVCAHVCVCVEGKGVHQDSNLG